MTRFTLAIAGTLLSAAVLAAQFHLPGISSSTGKSKEPAQSTPTPSAQPPNPTPAAAATPAFDYFVLALSWAPDFCANPEDAARNPRECAPGRSTAFAVHGLWPQLIAGKSPESCAPAKPVKKIVVNGILPYMPGPALVQHEWAVHGTCSGLTPTEFFSAVLTARSSLQIPVQFTSLEDAVMESPGQIEHQFAAANPSFPANAFRTACRNGRLSEVRVCFDKNLKPRACTASAGECSATVMRVPVMQEKPAP
ncbi:MAG TPA: ribonuclease T2 [Bryobacteraceae bacterium]|nr:ribonuclease T2 [Bryobacteraceae bacterium]